MWKRGPPLSSRSADGWSREREAGLCGGEDPRCRHAQQTVRAESGKLVCVEARTPAVVTLCRRLELRAGSWSVQGEDPRCRHALQTAGAESGKLVCVGARTPAVVTLCRRLELRAGSWSVSVEARTPAVVTRCGDGWS